MLNAIAKIIVKSTIWPAYQERNSEAILPSAQRKQMLLFETAALNRFKANVF